MAPKETLLSAACKPVELNADGELRRQRTPTENILISRMLMCSGYCHVVDTAVFHFHHAGFEIVQLRRPRCSHRAGMSDFTSFVVLTAAQLSNKFSILYDWSVPRRHIVRHSPEELCSTPASANGQLKVAQPSLDGPSQHLAMS